MQPPVFGRQDDGTWVTGRGVVCRLLSDDEEEERHQRFVIDLRNGQTVLIAHNVDVAERVPVALGDRLRFRGLYEWNPRGGVVHWTHRDPFGEEEGGALWLRRREYR